VFFTPLHFLSSTGARWVFTLGSLVSYLVVVGVIGWRLRLPWRHLALVALAGMALEPFVRTILLGQVNLYLMVAVVVDCIVIRSLPGRRHFRPHGAGTTDYPWTSFGASCWSWEISPIVVAQAAHWNRQKVPSDS
jgi:hypothetical protein